MAEVEAEAEMEAEAEAEMEVEGRGSEGGGSGERSRERGLRRVRALMTVASTCKSVTFSHTVREHCRLSAWLG